MFRTIITALTAVGIGMMSTPVLAQVFVGDTTGDPTFNRPIANGNNSPLSLSGFATAVPYEVLPFNVVVGGSYNFTVDANYDSYLGLYSGSFDPSNPLANALIYDDDGAGFPNAAFDYNLLTGTSYFAVVTGFGNDSFGPYTLTVTGPAAIVAGAAAVPEPGTWAMMLVGFGGIGYSMRKARRAKAVLQTA